MAQVHLGGVLYQEHDGSGLDLFARLLPMRLPQRLKSDIVFLEQSLQGYRLFPGLHVGGQGGRGILGHAFRSFHGPSCATNVIELTRPKSLFGPTFWVQNVLRVHLPILAACKMCIQDRALTGGTFTLLRMCTATTKAGVKLCLHMFSDSNRSRYFNA